LRFGKFISTVITGCLIVVDESISWGLSRVLYNMHEVTGFHEKAIITEELCIHLCNMIR
jgi:hypothetical protein